MRAVILAAVLLGLSSACDPCAGKVSGACPPALAIAVSDASTGAAVTNAQVLVAGPGCDGGTGCEPSSAGTYTLTVSAPGYVTQTLDVTVPPSPTPNGCFDCGYDPRSAVVVLTPQ